MVMVAVDSMQAADAEDSMEAADAEDSMEAADAEAAGRLPHLLEVERTFWRA